MFKGEIRMKKKFIFLLSVILILSCFAACGKPDTTEKTPDSGEEKNPEKEVPAVTQENVAELFETSLKAYFMDCGTAFCELETDENGNAVSYWENDELRNLFDSEDLTDYFKVVSDITAEEIINKTNAHTGVIEYDYNGELHFAEYNGELYVGKGYSVRSLYDLSSISLYSRSGDTYNITVDLYSPFTYDFNEDKIQKDVPEYWRSYVFSTTLRDGILYIEDVQTYPGVIKTDTSLRPENERNYMNFLTEYPGVSFYRKGESPEKVGDDKVNEDNVSELFKTSLEAYVMWDGSAFVEVERDENGYPKDFYGLEGYENIDEIFKYDISGCYKITNGITLEEIKNKVEAHTLKLNMHKSFDERFYGVYNGELYIGIGCYGTGIENFDENSIKLYKIDGDKYYITVDVYSVYAGVDILYDTSVVFETVFKDGILFIEDVKESGIIKNENELNPESERSYICDVSRFYNISE